MSFTDLLPAWRRLFEERQYAEFAQVVRAVLEERGEAFDLYDDHAQLAGWQLALLPIAEECIARPREEWPAIITRVLEQKSAEEKLGRELDAVRGNFARASEILKLRVQNHLAPNLVSAPIAGGLHAVLVLDLPSFVTPVRPADLAAWDRPAGELVELAMNNVKSREHIEVKPLEISGARIFAVSGASIFVATLGLAAEDLIGKLSPYGALVAMPSSHILLCHSIDSKASLKALEAMAAGAMQAFESGPSPLVPHLLWKRGDKFIALPVRREEGNVKCELPREFDEQVVSLLS